MLSIYLTELLNEEAGRVKREKDGALFSIPIARHGCVILIGITGTSPVMTSDG
jgi:hypothetical protein